MSRKKSTPTPEEFAAVAEREERLRRTAESLSRQLAESKYRTTELMHAVERATAEAMAGLVIPSVPKPLLKYGAGDEERAIVTLADCQIGKRTETYSTEIAEHRICENYLDRIARLTAIQRADHPVRHANVELLGDISEGELTFPGQPYQIDSSIFRQIVVDCPRILVRFLRGLLGMFETVHVTGVPGNHGINGPHARNYNPETNADRMIYFITQGLLANEPRLTWNLAYKQNDRAWYQVDYPFGDVGPGILTFHGDQHGFRSGTASPQTLAKRIFGWALGAVPERFNYVMYGHLSNPLRFELNEFVGWRNGTPESSNTYAQEELSSMGHPKQLLVFMHPRQGVTAEYWVRLDDHAPRWTRA